MHPQMPPLISSAPGLQRAHVVVVLPSLQSATDPATLRQSASVEPNPGLVSKTLSKPNTTLAAFSTIAPPPAGLMAVAELLSKRTSL